MVKKTAKDSAAAPADAAAGAPEAEEWVRVDAQGEPLADQGPTEEEVRARLMAANRAHTETLGDAWAVLTGQNPEAVMGQIAATVMHEGGTRPAWQWKREGQDHVLLAWPQDQPVRAAVLVAGEEGGKLRPVSAAPLLDGLPNDLTVEDVHPWKTGVDANVAVSMLEGRNPMWFYDPLYGRDRDDLTAGVTHTFLLAGLAYGLRRALLDEITITRGPQFEAHAAAWLAANPGKERLDVPPLKVNIGGKHMIMPGKNFCEYQMRGTVEDVQDCQLEKMPVKLLYLSFPFESRPALRLAVYASKMACSGYEPEAGHEVDAYVWLQGRIIDFDREPQPGTQRRQ